MPPSPTPSSTALRFYKLGDGPEYLVFNPYTLVQFEMPRSIAEVALDGDPLWSPSVRPVADVVAIAKRDLRPGDGSTASAATAATGRSTPSTARPASSRSRSPSTRCVVRSVARDAPIPLDAVEIDDTAPIVRLRAQQDAALGATV